MSNEQIRGDADTDLVEVVNIFDMRFFSVSVQHSTPCDVCQPPPPPPPANAIQMMMTAARDAAGKDLPGPIQDPKHGIDKLRNAILSYFEEKGCRFPRNAGPCATKLLSKLTDFLYYTDGQYRKLESVISRDKLVPPVFQERFSGFNCPEKSKYKKRTLDNLSESKLEGFTVQIRETIQGQPYLNSMPWAEVKVQILDLVIVIERYCLRLRNQRVRSKIVRETPRSHLEIATNITVMKANKGKVHPMLTDLDKELRSKDLYVPVAVREFLPTHERRRVHDLIEELIHEGLTVKCVHKVVEVGGNKPSLHFVWRLGENDDDEGQLINRCSQVIRTIEAEAPVYERRITKRQFLESFGFIGNPVALRAIFRELTRDHAVSPGEPKPKRNG